MTDDLIAQELDAYLRELSGKDGFSGSVLLARHWQPIYKNAFGLANKDFDVPNRIDTKFNLGSMNKMFTAVAIAQLVERGELSFDDQLSKYLPEFPHREAAEKIRIKHLETISKEKVPTIGGCYDEPGLASGNRRYQYSAHANCSRPR
jgi:CubicO group peptidase (beta-lactamase class C family)